MPFHSVRNAVAQSIARGRRRQGLELRLGVLGVLQRVAARALQASRHLHEPDDLRHLLVAGLGGRHQIGDAAAPGGVHPLQGRDERQRDLVLLQIEPRRLAGHRLGLGVVEQIVRDLERHAERAAKPRQRVTVRRGAAQAPTSHAPESSEAVLAWISASYWPSPYASLSCASSWRISPTVISLVTRANTRSGARSSRRTSSTIARE